MNPALRIYKRDRKSRLPEWFPNWVAVCAIVLAIIALIVLGS